MHILHMGRSGRKSDYNWKALEAAFVLQVDTLFGEHLSLVAGWEAVCHIFIQMSFW